MERVLVILGPTASGKSSLAVAAAQVLDGEVLSADSLQIYRGLNIGTAKITPVEQQGIVHHGLDLIDPDETYSVARFQADAYRTLAGILTRGKTPIVCGGTGLYLQALLEGFHYTPVEPDPQLRARLQQEIEANGPAGLYEKMCRLDPEAAARIPIENVRRLIRFFEVYQQTGLTQSKLNRKSRELGGPRYDYRTVGLALPRDVLHQRINLRARKMFEQGLLDEVAALIKRYPQPERCPGFLAIGYREALAVLRGELAVEAAIEQTAQATRQYAKRQMTWFRKQTGVHWLQASDRQSQIETTLNCYKI